MKRGWLRRPIRIGLGLLAFIVAAIAALFVWKPQETFLLFAILIHPLIANTRPPPFVADQFVGATFQNQAETNRKLNTLFQQKFPVGTSESMLKATLLGQGFKPLPPPDPSCFPAGQRAPVGVGYTTCPADDQSKALRYVWGSGVCGDTLIVTWSTDDSQYLTDTRVSYYGACL